MLFLGRCGISLLDFMSFGSIPKHGCFEIVRGWGWLRGGGAKACMREWVREKGGGGECWWGICWEGAAVVGCAWSLSLPSLPATVFWSGFIRLLFLRCLRMNSASFSCLIQPWCAWMLCAAHFSYEISKRDFHALFWAVVRFSYEISCFYSKVFWWVFLVRVHAFCYIICSWELMLFEPLRDFLLRFHALHQVATHFRGCRNVTWPCYCD